MKMRCRIFGFCCLAYVLMIFATQSVSAEQERLIPDWLAVSGWLDTVHSVRTASPHDKITSRARLRLEARADLDWFYGFCSLDAEKNWIISEETGIDAQEFWVEHVADTWDIRIGRQIIIWGQADGVQITDIISPPDLTESITRDLDEIRMPVDAVRLRMLGDTITTEFILIPFFRAAVYPEGDNPWAIPGKNPSQGNLVFLPATDPETSLENMEIAARISGYFSGLDTSASIFYTWDDTPTLHPGMKKTNSGNVLVMDAQHHRLTILGLGFSLPWSNFVFRGETAFYRGQYLPTQSPLEEPLSKNLIKWLVGMDWTPGSNWTITAQIMGQSIFHHVSVLSVRPNHFLGTLNLSKKLLNERLQLSNMIYIDWENKGFYDRIKADYEVSDGFHLSAGCDIFQGNDGQFKLYEKNSQVWFKAKYNF